MSARIAAFVIASLVASAAAAFEPSELGGRMALGVSVGAPLVSMRVTSEADWWHWRDAAAGLHLGLSAGRSPGEAWQSVVVLEPQALVRTFVFHHYALFSAGVGYAYVWSNPVSCDSPLCGWIMEQGDRSSLAFGAQATFLRPGEDGRVGAFLVRLEWLPAGLSSLSVSFGLDFGG